MVQGRTAGEPASGGLRFTDARGEQRQAHLIGSNRRAVVARIAEKHKAGQEDRKVLEHIVHHSLLCMGKRQAGGLKQCYALGSMLLGNRRSWLSCACTTFLEIVAHHIYSFMSLVFLALCGLFHCTLPHWRNCSGMV